MGIYVTGDTHGRHDWAKVMSELWPEGQGLTRDDYLVVLGDFGIWDESDLGPCGLLAAWEDFPWTTLFVDGNHENFDLLEAFPSEERWGGVVGVDPRFPHVVHLRRGYVYDLPTGGGEVARCFVMGGATSIDKAWRVEGESWWPQEMPSEGDYSRAEASLEAVGWRVDYVLTHDVPLRYKTRALGWGPRTGWRDPGTDALVEFLNDVDARLDGESLRVWYSGHYHRDAVLDPPEGRHVVLYDQIVRLGELPK